MEKFQNFRLTLVAAILVYSLVGNIHIQYQVLHRTPLELLVDGAVAWILGWALLDCLGKYNKS
jgi:hypothetical protein